MKARTVLLLCASVVVLVLAGWFLFRPKERMITVPAEARAGDIVLKRCTVKIGGIQFNADCGALFVPENRTDPESRLIALPLRRIRSSNPHPSEPIFLLDGGPGMSNMKFSPPTWLLAGHDFVQVGYRGVDGNPILDCPEVARAMKGVNGDLLSSASLDNLSASMGACATRLQAEGVDLKGYTIPEVVGDMESARKALGYARVDLLSESYGTRVAQIYASMHPASLLRSAMI